MTVQQEKEKSADIPCLLDLDNHFIIRRNPRFLRYFKASLFDAVEEEGVVGRCWM
jgi:hypothetical protein